MRKVLLLTLLLLSVTTYSQKINGVSLVSPPREISSAQFSDVKRVNPDWVAVIPYAFSRKGEPKVTFDHPEQWWGEGTEGSISLIKYAHEKGLKVMLKPHIWVMGEGWAGDFALETEDDWKIWENDFSKYILHFAKVADSLNVALFCIGTEYRIPAVQRPEFWRSLISRVREVYSGKITYASNWDNFDKIRWWGELDYLGIDAYFPLVESADPSTNEIKNGWEAMKQSLVDFHEKWQKPILFTEYGFQSVNGACGKHWEVDKSNTNLNFALQARAYDATFQCFMKEDWYAGGFFWKWHFHFWKQDRLKAEWTPQDKPAEQVIANWYGKKK